MSKISSSRLACLLTLKIQAVSVALKIHTPRRPHLRTLYRRPPFAAARASNDNHGRSPSCWNDTNVSPGLHSSPAPLC
ncbi:hypothetical protein F4778DRAFT_138766 [Xylariomycetidae sp. FL2044]|nr:hypothetical protein F4778DRAFT_138766 [Xylariomycetidae sp. FL2044]